MNTPAQKRCPACGATNLGIQTQCMLCGAALDGAPSSAVRSAPESKEITGGSGRLFLGLITFALLIAAIVYGPDLLKAWQKTDEEPKPHSSEQWSIKPPKTIPTTEKGTFRNVDPQPDEGSPKDLEELLVQQLIKEMAFDDNDARQLLRDMGTGGAQEFIRDYRKAATESVDPPDRDVKVIQE